MRSRLWIFVGASGAAGLAVWAADWAGHAWFGARLLEQPFGIPWLAALALACLAYWILGRVERFDPVVRWPAGAWRRGDHAAAIARLRRLRAVGLRRPAYEAFLLVSAGRAAEAYQLVSQTLGPPPERGACDPTRDLGLAAGRALMALGRYGESLAYLRDVYRRCPRSATARFALGDLLLWMGGDPQEARRLLEEALAETKRGESPHWRRLGFAAELRASHAWALGCLGRPAEMLHSVDRALTLAGKRGPVRAAVCLRLGNATEALGRSPRRARSYWKKAVEADAEGWAGRAAAAALARAPLSPPGPATPAAGEARFGPG